MSTLVWLSVSSNRNDIRHAIGKLGQSSEATAQSICPCCSSRYAGALQVCFIAGLAYHIELKARRLALLFLGILPVVVLTAAFGILFDEWFSVFGFLGLAPEVAEIAASGLIGWFVLFRPIGQNGVTSAIGSTLFGLFGLLLVTSLGLLAVPRVSFRF
jgi:hypothetical protein